MKEILKYRASKLRKNGSQVERIMWVLLRNRKLSHFKFRRQYIIAPYIVDFVCLKRKLIIEMDGDHHEAQTTYDEKRTHYLKSLGYMVLRFSNISVLNDRVDQILSDILKALAE
jgi:very-short-patch-repair endonuclease